MGLTDLSFVVTEEIVNANRVVDNLVWLPIKFTKISKELTKNVGKDGNKSWNYVLNTLVTEGDYKGMNIRVLYNEKFLPPCLPMFAAVMGRPIQAGESLDFMGLMDKEAMMQVAPAMSDKGTKFNKVIEWKPISK